MVICLFLILYFNITSDIILKLKTELLQNVEPCKKQIIIGKWF